MKTDKEIIESNEKHILYAFSCKVLELNYHFKYNELTSLKSMDDVSRFYFLSTLNECIFIAKNYINEFPYFYSTLKNLFGNKLITEIEDMSFDKSYYTDI